MLAAILSQPGGGLQLRDDVTALAPGPGEVTVAVRAAGLCHSDLLAMAGDLFIPVPAVMGHEAAGVVDRVGPGVSRVTAGDHVVIGVSTPCGTCTQCVARRSPHLCGDLFFKVAAQTHFRAGTTELAAMGAIGAFAEAVTVREESLVPVPRDVPFDVLALLGCGVTSGVGAVVNTVDVPAGATVAILGMGGVGIAAVQGARICGASLILAVDPLPGRRETALAFGATHACGPGELDQVTRQLTGDGFDYAFEAAGQATAMRAAYDAVRRGGTACVVGAGPASQRVSFSAGEIYYQEKRFVGSYHGSADFRSDVDRLLGYWRSGRLDLAGMITHRYALGDIDQALDTMTGRVGVRVVVLPSGRAA